MLRSIAIVLHLHVVFFAIGAEADGSVLDYPPPDYTTLRPSLAVVIGILSVMFVLTFLLLLYAKFCHRPARPAELDRPVDGRNGSAAASRRFSGLDKTVVESLPFFRFSALRGARDGLECAVCLSKFEDVEVLRLLPKCRHAFHIGCIDHWLERHSTCPLCRHRVSSDDLKLAALSNSLRFLNGRPAEPGSASNGVELFVQREESRRRGSSRFGSFRKVGGEEEDVLIRSEAAAAEEEEGESGGYDKHNHRILLPEFAFRSRWSNVSSSDLIVLSSEMLIAASSARFSPETEASSATKERSVVSSSGERRSVSEITAVSRYRNTGHTDESGNSLSDQSVREERVRRVWLPIVRRTVQWFANRESRNQQRQALDV